MQRINAETNINSSRTVQPFNLYFPLSLSLKHHTHKNKIIPASKIGAAATYLQGGKFREDFEEKYFLPVQNNSTSVSNGHKTFF